MIKISTRLPAPEIEFQNDQPSQGGFLSDAIGSNGTAHLPAFTECIIQATICGRSIAHKHQTTVERLYGHVSQDFWDRQCWLDTILTKRIQVLSMQEFFPSDQIDPSRLFARMLAHASFLYLSNIVTSSSLEPSEQQLNAMRYEKRALSSAQDIVRLAKALPQLSCLRVSPLLLLTLISFLSSERAFCGNDRQAHPFTPVPLILCAEYFLACSGLENGFRLELSEVSEALRDLKSVNNLAQDYLHLVEKTCGVD